MAKPIAFKPITVDFKADLQISNMDTNYYQSHALTLAQHPSETEERLMVRLLVFALHADGLSQCALRQIPSAR